MLKKTSVWIVMGSDSDLSVMSDAAKILEQFDIAYRISIASAHRCTDYLLEQTRSAEAEGIQVIIAGAGLAAHLPGVIAAVTTLPVIGVPLQSGPLAGQDALHAIVQMPPGIPVATVAINGARNAALLALEMMALAEPSLREKLQQYRQRMRDDVLAKNDRLQALGYAAYLEDKK